MYYVKIFTLIGPQVRIPYSNSNFEFKSEPSNLAIDRVIGFLSFLCRFRSDDLDLNSNLSYFRRYEFLDPCSLYNISAIILPKSYKLSTGVWTLRSFTKELDGMLKQQHESQAFYYLSDELLRSVDDQNLVNLFLPYWSATRLKILL